MRRGALGLFVGLPIAGALLGLLTGQLAIGGRNGLYVVPAAALVGLLLAWALWASRPRAGAEQGAPVVVEEEVVRPQAKAQSDTKERRQAGERQRGSSVKVTRSGRPDNTGRKGR
jgi:Flp pilus assembly protein TadB